MGTRSRRFSQLMPFPANIVLFCLALVSSGYVFRAGTCQDMIRAVSSIEYDSYSFRPLGGSLPTKSLSQLRNATDEVISPVNVLYVNTSRPFFLCVAPKTGSTAWKNLFLFVNSGILLRGEDIRRNPGLVHKMGTSMVDYHFSIKERFFNQRNRYVIARNPYARFLSSYQDWLGRVNQTKASVSFRDFTLLYRAQNLSKYAGTLFDHIDPISHYCKYREVGYSAVLRLEEESLWYDEFLDKNGLSPYMEDFKAGGNFVYKSPLTPSSKVRDYLKSITGEVPWPGQKFDSRHHRNSDSKLFDFYTPELATIVSHLFHDDFAHFQYPLWDGDTLTFRFV